MNRSHASLVALASTAGTGVVAPQPPSPFGWRRARDGGSALTVLHATVLVRLRRWATLVRLYTVYCIPYTTLRRWATLVPHRPGLIRVFASSYGGKTITDFIHGEIVAAQPGNSLEHFFERPHCASGWAYFHLMHQVGATTMSVMKAAVSARTQ